MSSKTPRPGQRVRGSATGKPIMALFDLLGRRWALGIIWSLADGPQTFRGLQEHCNGISPTVLNTRLKELRSSDLIMLQPNGYTLTPMGATLFAHLKPLGQWSRDWADTLPQSH